VIRDAKPENVGRFDDGGKLTDVSDHERFVPYDADPGQDDREQFLNDCAAVYGNLVRSATSHPFEEAAEQGLL